jgi:siderophore synthetase component
MRSPIVEHEPVSAANQASAAVMHALVDAMLQENLFGILDHGEMLCTMPEADGIPGFALDREEVYFRVPLQDSDSRIVFRVRRNAFLQPYRLSRPPALQLSSCNGEPAWQALTPDDLANNLATAREDNGADSAWPNLPALLDDLRLSIEQTALSLAATATVATAIAVKRNPGLVAWERFAALQDRPFHPTARAKSGWTVDDYRRYGAEHGHDFGLAWVAVARDFISVSSAAGGCEPAETILNETERQKLQEAMQRAGLPMAEYCALPVHPWHQQQVLPEVLSAELARGICVSLTAELGRFVATSSVRSLAPVSGGAAHIKLPLGIRSLGALRILPPRYLHNGTQGQQLLEQVIARSATMDGRPHLCAEDKWWAFFTPEDGPLADRPGYLACMLRTYPEHLIDSPGVSLVPMSALPVVTPEGRMPAMEQLLSQWPGHGNEGERALALFSAICTQLIEFAFVCFGYGVMPEVHGQNVLLVVRAGRLDGLLLRDHDTVRIHRPWLRAHGLSEPDYVLNLATPGTMINPSPEDLLMYFQTLGVQVNLYAIINALAQAYPVAERDGWQVVKTTIETALARLDLPDEARRVLERELLHKETWPTKLLLAPFLASKMPSAGMPTGRGLIANPFRSLTAGQANRRVSP